MKARGAAGGRAHSAPNGKKKNEFLISGGPHANPTMSVFQKRHEMRTGANEQRDEVCREES